MKYFISVLLFLLSFSINAQTWVQPGATWKYEYNDNGFCYDWDPFKYEYSVDTIIEGKTCQTFTSTSYNYYSYNGQTTLDSTIRLKGITYVNGDTIFHRHNEQFFVLFNFGAQVGDSWIISDSIENQNSSDFVCGDTSKVTVTSTGLVEHDGNSYRTITLETAENSPYHLNGTFIERFGRLSNNTYYSQHNFIFPEVDSQNCEEGTIYEWCGISFDCYYDDNFTFNPSDGCGFFLNISNNETDLSLGLFPNPTNNSLTINSKILNGLFEITNLTGKIIKTGPINSNSTKIDVSELNESIYFIKITDEFNNSQTLKFAKN